MGRRESRLLVVDASVVQSAGETEHPESSACRECLLAVRSICHRVVLSAEIRDEWDRHLSRFARKWRVSMAARRKPLQTVKPTALHLNLVGLSEADRRAIEKDRCLLEVAVSADRVIITRDDSLRKALARMPKRGGLVETITWINPVSDGVVALERL